jgi:hypothetical protein
MAGLNRHTIPGMTPDIDFNRAMIRTDTTLDTTGRIRYNLAGNQGLAARGILLEEVVKAH